MQDGSIQNIAVIGGGPAGFMAAITALENSSGKIHIDILEKNVPLKTILLTGNGRCNLSNEIFDYKELASNFPRGEKFLYSVFSRFGVKETLDWFSRHGVKTYVQEDKRIFPDTDRASTVREMFLNKAKELSISVYSECSIKKISRSGEKFIIETEKCQKCYDKAVIATGGSSRDASLSGYDYAKSFGHTIKDLKPSLSALLINEDFVGKLAGISVKDAVISAYFNNNQVIRSTGDFIFTHTGLSGPLIFKTSAYCAYINYSKSNPLILKINFVPDIEKDRLEKELIDEFNSNPHKELDNILKKYLPKSLICTLLSESGIDIDKKANQVTKEDRKKVVKILTETELSVISPAPDGEIVTAGGVSLVEINPKTMESKLVKGLYFCGEVMDIDGLTGGFNLQGCWSTGYIAGLSIADCV